MGLPHYRATETGRIEEVSYTLLKNNRKYCFRGVPDYVVVKDGVGADQILIATGEVQSTNLPAIHNSILELDHCSKLFPIDGHPLPY